MSSSWGLPSDPTAWLAGARTFSVGERGVQLLEPSGKTLLDTGRCPSTSRHGWGGPGRWLHPEACTGLAGAGRRRHPGDRWRGSSCPLGIGQDLCVSRVRGPRGLRAQGVWSPSATPSLSLCPEPALKLPCCPDTGGTWHVGEHVAKTPPPHEVAPAGTVPPLLSAQAPCVGGLLTECSCLYKRWGGGSSRLLGHSPVPAAGAEAA